MPITEQFILYQLSFEARFDMSVINGYDRKSKRL